MKPNRVFAAMKASCLLLLGLTSSLELPAAGPDVEIEKIAYGGWPNCIRMSNGTVELIATTDVGPRIIRYGFVGDRNEFFENEEQLGITDSDVWLAFGGHRLWLAPEAKPRSYYPDTEPVKAARKGDALHLIAPTETENGVRKEITVSLSPSGTHVQLVHKLTNHNIWEIEVAPWTLTVMPPNGKAIIPREPYAPHPDMPDFPGQKTDRRFYFPVRSLALWSFTNLADPRWEFTGKYIILRQDPELSKPQKLGMSNKQDWGAYLRQGHLFVKQSVYQHGATYPDRGCSFEIFTNGDMLELEALGPLTSLPPGGSLEHQEHWYLFDDVTAEDTDESIDANVLPKIHAVLHQ